jgi:hypothetical protein
MPIDSFSATALAAVGKWLYGHRSQEGNLGAEEVAARRVMVAFVDERGNLLQEAWLAAVPRAGEEVELIILPKLDPASSARMHVANWNGFARLKSALKILILGGDKEMDKLIEASVEGTEAADPKIVQGTVLRVRWTPFVASPEHPEYAVTAVTVVLEQRRTSRST